MKKTIFVSALTLALLFTTSTNAQSALTSKLKSAASSAINSASAAASEASDDVIGNLIASATGSVTTTQSNLVGSWKYSKPCVQFEDENLLNSAGGSAIATKIEDKLATYYKLAGIKPGDLVFKFTADGKVTYGVGSLTKNGTYEFNDAEKTVTIKVAGISIKTYVTVSGDNMALTFEAKKLVDLMTTLSSKFQSLKSITSLASQYDGVKVGFEFERAQ